MGIRPNGNDGSRANRRRETMAPEPLPPGHRLGLRRRQAHQTAGLDHRVHRAHLPRHTLSDPPGRRWLTHSQEGNIMNGESERDPDEFGEENPRAKIIASWLNVEKGKNPDYLDFSLYELDELCPASGDIYECLQQFMVEAKVRPAVLERFAQRLGWEKTREYLIDTIQPTKMNMRLGDFGEILTCHLLEMFFEYYIPVKKLLYKLSPNQSLPATDTLAFKMDGSRIAEICYVESKLRTGRETMVAVQGYNQLYEDYSKHVPDMIRFLLNICSEYENDFFYQLLEYTCNRQNMKELDKFTLGLILDVDNWSERILKNLSEEIDESYPELTVLLIRITQLSDLVKKVYESIGAMFIDDA